MMMVSPQPPAPLLTWRTVRVQPNEAECNVAPPAKLLAPDRISAQTAQFPNSRFIATGGADGSNAQNFLTIGAAMVSAGSAPADPKQIPALRGLVHNHPRGSALSREKASR